MHTCLAAAAVLALPTLSVSLKLPQGKSQRSNIVEGAYLVQLSTGSTIPSRDSETTYANAHEAFHKRAEVADLDCKCPLTVWFNFNRTLSVQWAGNDLNADENVV